MTTYNEDIKLEGYVTFKNNIDANNNLIKEVSNGTSNTDAINKSQINPYQKRRCVLIDAKKITSPQTTVVFDLGTNYADYDYFKLVGTNVIGNDETAGIFTWRGASGTVSSYTVNTTYTEYSHYYGLIGSTAALSDTAGTNSSGFNVISRLQQEVNFQTHIYDINKVARKFSISNCVEQQGTNDYDANNVYIIKTATFQYNSLGSSYDEANNILLFDLTNTSYTPLEIAGGDLMLYGYISDTSNIKNTSSVNSITSYNGNIGINNTTPSDKLEVNGDIKLYGYLYGPTNTVVKRVVNIDLSTSSTTSTSYQTFSELEYYIVKPGNNLIGTANYNLIFNGYNSDNYWGALRLIQYDSSGTAISGGDSGEVRESYIKYQGNSGGGGRAMTTCMQYIFSTLSNCYSVRFLLRFRENSADDACTIKNKYLTLMEVSS